MTTGKRSPLVADVVQRLQGRAVPHTDPVAAAVTEDPPARAAAPRRTASHQQRSAARGDGGRAEGTGTRLPPSRAGKVPITHWTEDRIRHALKTYAVANRTTVDELVTEALADLMKKRGIKL